MSVQDVTTDRPTLQHQEPTRLARHNLLSARLPPKTMEATWPAPPQPDRSLCVAVRGHHSITATVDGARQGRRVGIEPGMARLMEDKMLGSDGRIGVGG
jgi:hypothetical protein